MFADKYSSGRATVIADSLFRNCVPYECGTCMRISIIIVARPDVSMYRIVMSRRTHLATIANTRFVIISSRSRWCLMTHKQHQNIYYCTPEMILCTWKLRQSTSMRSLHLANIARWLVGGSLLCERQREKLGANPCPRRKFNWLFWWSNEG